MYDIGLLGPARSGKDTAAAHLVDRFGYRRIAFADPVRESLLAVNPIVEVHPHGSDADVLRLSDVVREEGWEGAKDNCPEVRRLLQAYASDAVRGVVGAGAWLQLGMNSWTTHRLEGAHVVFTDVRFPNEVETLRAHGVRLVYAHRPGFGPANGHASETAVGPDDADIILPNRGSIADLHASIATLVEE